MENQGKDELKGTDVAMKEGEEAAVKVSAAGSTEASEKNEGSSGARSEEEKVSSDAETSKNT